MKSMTETRPWSERSTDCITAIDENFRVGRAAERAGSDVVSIVELFDEVIDGVVAIDPTGRCAYANPAFRRLLGSDLDPLGPPFSTPAWVCPEHRHRWQRLSDMFLSRSSVVPGVVTVEFAVIGAQGRFLITTSWDGPISLPGERSLVLVVCRPRSDARVTPPVVDSAESTSLESKLETIWKILTDIDTTSLPRTGRVPSSASSPGELLPTHVEETIEQRQIFESLSLREQEILRLVVEGKRVSTMAERLFLSEHTIRNHLKHVYRKMGVHSASELRETQLSRSRH